jgi:hypothetical protein
MNWKWFGGNGGGIVEILSKYLPEVAEETTINLSIAGVLSGNRIQYIQDTGLERYRCINLFDDSRFE